MVTRFPVALFVHCHLQGALILLVSTALLLLVYYEGVLTLTYTHQATRSNLNKPPYGCNSTADGTSHAGPRPHNTAVGCHHHPLLHHSVDSIPMNTVPRPTAAAAAAGASIAEHCHGWRNSSSSRPCMNSQQAHCHRFKGHTSPLPRPQQREHGLVAPQYAAVAASRAALQAYLDGPQFATAAAAVARPSHAVGYAPGTSSQQLPNNPEPQAAVRTWQDQKQQQQQEQRWWHEAAVGSALGREGTDSRSRSSSSPPWRRGILVVAGGRKLLTHLVVQLKVCHQLALHVVDEPACCASHVLEGATSQPCDACWAINATCLSYATAFHHCRFAPTMGS